MSDEAILIGVIDKSSVERVKVSLVEANGKLKIDLRTWWQSDPSNPASEIPTKKGIRLDSSQIPELIQLIQQANQRAKKFGDESDSKPRSPQDEGSRIR